MKWFVWYTTNKYEPETLQEFATYDDCIAFINANAENTDFKFRVIEGKEHFFESEAVTIRYRLKR